ncbi:hypothetical protein QM583_02155 [Gordonia alkanivorans]|uniref:TPR repeat region-containing protein n=1 Tax=Gordonia alkanivorans TaxID=84096 RepID=UPI0024B7CE30|nr:hypothetical protein [Gordonia alkanivorans]MDJ0025892.1 hypothetical protein [Gordonia alkanivorans]
MVYPTRSIVAELNFDKMPALAEDLTEYAEYTASDARMTRDTITGLDWSGGAKNAAETRAHREHAQLMRVSATFTSLANTITTGHTDLSSLAGNLKLTATAYEDNDYSVADNWKVTDSYNYALAETAAAGDDKQLKALETLKTTRAQIAVNATLWMERIATEFDTADTSTAAAIRSANSTLDQLTPPAAGLSAGSAEKILDDWEGGRGLSREQMYALAAAGNLTPEQLQALHAGLPVNIPQGQYDFLRTLFRGLDGMSVDEIAGLGGTGEQGAAVRNLLSNGMQILSAPSVSTTSGDSGGMAVLPTNVASLLTEKLHTGTAKTRDYDNHTTFDYPHVPRIDEFEKLVGLLESGDPALRMGTDIDRGILKQASEIAEASRSGRIAGAGEELTDTHDVLNRALALASADTTAVRDFTVGAEAMNVTYSDGRQFDADRHLDALFAYQWGDSQGGISDMYKWLGQNTGNPDNTFAAFKAADTASALGQYFGDSSNVEIGRDLGRSSPLLTQTLATSLAPFLADFAGAHQPGTPNEFPLFGGEKLTAGELKNLFMALNSDPTAAGVINRAGAEWQFYMAYSAGMDPGAASLGNAAGVLQDAMKDGMDAQIDYLKKEGLDDHAEQMRVAAAGRNILAAIPNVGAPLNAMMPVGTVEELLFGPAPDYDSVSTDEINALTQLRAETLTDPDVTKFAIFAGVAAADPGLRLEHPEWFDENGNPSWEAIHGNDGPTLSERASMTPAEREAYDREHSQRETTFNEWRSFVARSGHYDRWDTHFDSGVEQPDEPGQPVETAPDDSSMLPIPGLEGGR